MPLDIDEIIRIHLQCIYKTTKVEYNTDELHELCTRAIKVFSAEPLLVKMNRSCAIVGSLYGKFQDLLQTFISHIPNFVNDNSFLTKSFVFLGNYVDHGKRAVEILSLLLALKIRHPDRFHLVRGSHECTDINRACGFFDELLERFGSDEGEKLFDHFNEVFAWMPLACVVKRRFFCVHGGISPHLRSLEDIDKIPRPLTDPLSNPLAANLLWSEPDEKATGFRIHPKRDFAVLFGADNVAKFRNDTDIQMIVRGGDKPLGLPVLIRPVVFRNVAFVFGVISNVASVSMGVDDDLGYYFFWIRHPSQNVQ